MFRRFGEGTVEERIANVCDALAGINERTAGIWQAVVEASGTDPEVEEWRLAWEAGRRLDTRRGTALVIGREPDEDLVMAMWILTSADAYLRLTVDAGLTVDEYKAFLAQAAHRLFTPI